MRFPMPNFPCELELPDAWLAEAGLLIGFSPSTPAYRSEPDARLVPLREIEPPHRDPEYQKDWHGFDRERLIKVLRGFVDGEVIPPVPLLELQPHPDSIHLPYRYRVLDGFHRFYGSVAAGFQHLPGILR